MAAIPFVWGDLGMVAVGFFVKVPGISFKSGSHYVAGLELEILQLQPLERCNYQCAHYCSLLEIATIFKAENVFL